MAEKICPLLCAGTPEAHRCVKTLCAWYLEDEGRCAIASLPTVLDLAVRISTTKPYEGDKDAE